jgi:hypothetical protein
LRLLGSAKEIGLILSDQITSQSFLRCQTVGFSCKNTSYSS